MGKVREELEKRIATGRLPITMTNIEFVMIDENQTLSNAVKEYSSMAGLTIVGFSEDLIKHDPAAYFTDFSASGDILFVNASHPKDII
jgi:hypothetical protein